MEALGRAAGFSSVDSVKEAKNVLSTVGLFKI